MTDAAGSPAPEEKIDKKDVTLDFLIDGGEEEGDRTGAGGAPPVEDRGDHPAIVILDMAVKQSGEYLRKEGLPGANTAVYEHFSKPFLNTALWHYLPDGSIPDDPRLALALGVGGLALAFLPTILAYHAKEAEEEKRAKAKKEKKREEREEGEEKEEKVDRTFRNVITGEEIGRASPAAGGPDWLSRMGEYAGSGLPGM